MRLHSYRDESHSRHFDLIGGGGHSWSIDLVSVTASGILVVHAWQHLTRRTDKECLRRPTGGGKNPELGPTIFGTPSTSHKTHSDHMAR